jgi:hypothetical protein
MLSASREIAPDHEMEANVAVSQKPRVRARGKPPRKDLAHS